jgi:hypothetical protein
MSEITYALRSPQLVKSVLVETEHGIVKLDVASMSFLYQPVWGWRGDKYNAPYERALVRLENLWRGLDVPRYAAFTDSRKSHRIEVGQTVYAWHDRDNLENILEKS